jgi:hypothetical protein
MSKEGIQFILKKGLSHWPLRSGPTGLSLFICPEKGKTPAAEDGDLLVTPILVNKVLNSMAEEDQIPTPTSTVLLGDMVNCALSFGQTKSIGVNRKGANGRI